MILCSVTTHNNLSGKTDFEIMLLQFWVLFNWYLSTSAPQLVCILMKHVSAHVAKNRAQYTIRTIQS